MDWVGEHYGMKPEDILKTLKGRQAVKFLRPLDCLPRVIYMPKERSDEKMTLLNDLIQNKFPSFLEDLDDILNSMGNEKFLCGDFLTIYDFRVCSFFC